MTLPLRCLLRKSYASAAGWVEAADHPITYPRTPFARRVSWKAVREVRLSPANRCIADYPTGPSIYSPYEPSTYLPKTNAEFIEPMECALVSTLPEGSDWTYEVKLDGYRAIGVRSSDETILYSRNHKNFNKRFPQIAEALGDLPAHTVVDGEVVARDESGRPDFHRLQHFTAEASRIHYFVFDLLILKRRDLTQLPLT